LKKLSKILFLFDQMFKTHNQITFEILINTIYFIYFPQINHKNREFYSLTIFTSINYYISITNIFIFGNKIIISSIMEKINIIEHCWT